MIANRRSKFNFSLQRAAEYARQFRKPLLILEALRCDYRWNCDRIHWFVTQGMRDNQAEFAQQSVHYYPYLEPELGAGKGLLAALAQHACVVVSDDFPCFFLPNMTDAAARQIPVTFELVDSNGLYPMRHTDRIFKRAYDFRRHLQKHLRPFLQEQPLENPLSDLQPQVIEIPESISQRWPATDLESLIAQGPQCLGRLPINHEVAVSNLLPGGRSAALQRLNQFVNERLAIYGTERNHPDVHATSGLSAYLHFGHISAHEIFLQATACEAWSIDQIADKANGSSSGWWGTSETLESFLDQLITWRELGHNMCALTDNYDRYESLPDWSRHTLQKHASDRREYIYTLEEFEESQTHDRLWNAAQNQLRHEGIIHNYLRMLWGKKILHWTESPQIALEYLIELNNKYALDGRNPNSYSGIFWCLGRYDRPWGPERKIFGKVRYMTSESTVRKLRVRSYIEQYSDSISTNQNDCGDGDQNH